MIRMTKISSGADAAKYFDAALVERAEGQHLKGADNYYVGENSKAVWGGRAAGILGLEGLAATRQDFINIMEGKVTNPQTGIPQDLSKNSQQRRAGYDLTWSAPKSASIAALVHGDDRITEAYKASVEAAMGMIQDYAAQYRQREGGGPPETFKSDSLIWASVQHETSRDGDPQLHIHSVLASITVDANGKFHSLTNDEIIKGRAYLMAAEFQNRDFERRCNELGYSTTRDKKGNFELDVISKESIKEQSKRSTAIDKHLRDQGIHPKEATFEQKRAASLATRKPKDEKSREESLKTWVSETDPERYEKENAAIEKIIQGGITQSYISEPALDKALAQALAHISESEFSFRNIELINEVQRFSVVKATLGQIESVIAKAKAEGTIVAHEGPVRFLTTKDLQALESKMLQTATGSIGAHRPIYYSHDDLEKAVHNENKRFIAKIEKEHGGKCDGLTSEQLSMVKEVLGTRNGVTLVSGWAGTGKSTAISAIKELAEVKGWRVIGVAPSSKATGEVRSVGIVDAKNVSKFLADLKTIPRELDFKIEAKKAETTSLYHGYIQIDANVRTLGLGIVKDTYIVNLKDMSVFRAPKNLLSPIQNAALAAKEILNTSAGKSKGAIDKEETPLGKAGALVGYAAARLAAGTVKLGIDYEKINTGSIEHAAISALAVAKIAGEKIQILQEVKLLEKEKENIEKTGNKEAKPQLMVVDEVGMVGTADLAKLIEYGKQTNTKMILQGDDKQFGSINGGRGAPQLADAFKNIGIGQVELTAANRYKTEQTKEIYQALYSNNYEKAVDLATKKEFEPKYTFDENYQPLEDNSELYKAAAKEYIEKSMDGKSVAVITITNADRIGVNEEIRQELKAAGKIDVKEFEFLNQKSAKLSEVEKIDVNVLKDREIEVLQVFMNIKLSNDPNAKPDFVKGEQVRVLGYYPEQNEIKIMDAKGNVTTINPETTKGFEPVLIEETRNFAKGDLVDTRAIIGTEYKLNKYGEVMRDEKTGEKLKNPSYLTNGESGKIKEINKSGATIVFGEGNKTKEVRLDHEQMKNIDHAFARTAHAWQGGTRDHAIAVLSASAAKVVNRENLLVIETRARDSVTFMTTDLFSLRRNAAELTEKTTALNAPKLETRIQKPPEKTPETKKQQPEKTL